MGLGKSLAEIRNLSAKEFRDWQLFYMLEPWGWANDEYRTAALLAQTYNLNRGKRRAKNVTDFMRDMLMAALSQLQDEPPELVVMSDEQRREFIRAQVKKDFGIK